MKRSPHFPEIDILASHDSHQALQSEFITRSYLENIRSSADAMRQPALIFILENRKQIEQKSKKFGVDFDDVCQEICLIFIEKASSFDASRGTFKGFIFGQLDKLLRRKSIGALRFAASINDDSERSAMIRAQVESLATTDADETNTCGRTITVPGRERLEASAQIISGKSARELAAERGITTRRMNQILKSVREEAAVQFDFEFAKEKK